ncbi:DUF167 family protein [Aestuariirhabdus litorea]|uniref:UPF0235 protein D0544_06610 n=1 Tax=Aestuariirhabdus litorea TaxID=2528527 RepID=A0A3P3VSU6_9GAMM|nr:DUF167 family protein [Aestuariirhabdus litorea]RRJ84766.1 YggU family protein [Aestuariirhabdus litorea]RWW97990.1 YggU family protein [Endozoicomonadaceae bacterium GTF-13]
MDQPLPFAWQDNRLILSLLLQPKASANRFCDLKEGRIKVQIKAPPVDGKANSELITFLAKQFRTPKGAVFLISGESSRRKRVAIESPKCLPEPLLRLGLAAPE